MNCLPTVLPLVGLWVAVAGALVSAETVGIPTGTFSLGGSGGEVDEQPATTVKVSPFRIDKFEVSHAQYDTCVKRGACSRAHYDDGTCLLWTSRGFRRVVVPLRFRSPRYPVVCVTWQQARQYCRWKGGDLPTEAQWEYAALAGSGKTFAWGNASPGPTRCAQASEHKPRAVGSFSPNSWGLHDMTGNVWEWSRDRYHRDYYRFAQPSNPQAPGVGRYRSIRGGGWYSGTRQLRIKNRHWFAPERSEVSVGFRCVK